MIPIINILMACTKYTVYIAHSHEPLSKPKEGTALIMSIYDAVHITESLRPNGREA